MKSLLSTGVTRRDAIPIAVGPLVHASSMYACEQSVSARGTFEH